MSFPRKTHRSEFGPEPKNRAPVRQPEFEMDAETVGRLLMFQVAGSGIMVPMAQLLIATTAAGGGSATLLERHEAWNPRYLTTGDYAPPQVTRVSAGVFNIVYPANVPDNKGELAPLEFVGGTAVYTDITTTALFARAFANPMKSSVAQVRGWLLGGSATPTDGTFLVRLYS